MCQIFIKCGKNQDVLSNAIACLFSAPAVFSKLIYCATKSLAYIPSNKIERIFVRKLIERSSDIKINCRFCTLNLMNELASFITIV
jgi:hypothetical protein